MYKTLKIIKKFIFDKLNLNNKLNLKNYYNGTKWEDNLIYIPFLSKITLNTNVFLSEYRQEIIRNGDEIEYTLTPFSYVSPRRFFIGSIGGIFINGNLFESVINIPCILDIYIYRISNLYGEYASVNISDNKGIKHYRFTSNNEIFYEHNMDNLYHSNNLKIDIDGTYSDEVPRIDIYANIYDINYEKFEYKEDSLSFLGPTSNYVIYKSDFKTKKCMIIIEIASYSNKCKLKLNNTVIDLPVGKSQLCYLESSTNGYIELTVSNSHYGRFNAAYKIIGGCYLKENSLDEKHIIDTTNFILLYEK